MRGRRIAAAMCRIIGYAIMIAVILSCLVTVAPRWIGYEPYAVISGSMEPEIPTGSFAYVKKCEPEEIADGEIIAFLDMTGNTVVHRAVRNRIVEGEIVTRGDANDADDMRPAPYRDVIGQVKAHVPLLGYVSTLYGSSYGKAYLVALAACGALLVALAARIRGRDES